MNTCLDCKHARRDWAGKKYSRCAAEVSFVTGEPRWFCSVQRETYGSCGPEGKLFEKKVTFFKRIFG